MHRFALVIAAFCLASGALASERPCALGQQYWCRNKATARQCGVLAWCKLQWDVQEKEMASFPTTPPVAVTLYFEVLCGGCRQWILDNAWPTYQKLQGTGVMTLELVPFGNAYVQRDGTVECQHGPEECYGNKVESCAIHCLQDTSKWFPFVHCLESGRKFTDATAQSCAETTGIEYQPIRDCVNGEEGHQLILKNKAKTDALSPSHTFVPWLTMNGKHNDDIQDGLSYNMLSYVCAAYKGTKPAACQQAPQHNRCYNKNKQ